MLLVAPSSKINEHTTCLRNQVTYLFRLCVDISVINTRVLELGLLKTERYEKWLDPKRGKEPGSWKKNHIVRGFLM
jgi:hypothetical protein